MPVSAQQPGGIAEKQDPIIDFPVDDSANRAKRSNSTVSRDSGIAISVEEK